MKIIYYSTAYFASHGGSNHSKSFVECARRNENVAELIVFPNKEIIKRPITPASDRKKGLINYIKSWEITSLFRFYRRSKFYLNEILNEIERIKPDAIIIRLDSNFTQVTSIKKKYPDLIVATEINASPFDEGFRKISFRSLFQLMERKHLSHADLNFFVSNVLREQIMKSLVDKERDVVLPNGVDTSLFIPAIDKKLSRLKLNLPVGKKIIGYVGTFDITKRMDVLLKAFSSIHKMRDDVYFVMVGDGPEFNSLKNQLIENDLQEVLLLTGNVTHTEVPSYLQSFDIAVHHAAGDYMCPLKLFEYLATGIPVVGPDTPAVREIFENETHLFLCKPDVESIVKKINSCLDDLRHANDMAQKGLTLVNAKYTWQINADTIINRILSREAFMRILQIIQKKQLRGAEIFACQLAQQLIQKGIHVDIVHLFSNDNFTLDFNLNFVSLGASQKKRFWDLMAYQRLAKIIRKGRYDIVQANAGDTLKYAVFSKFIFGWNARLVFRNANRMSSFIVSGFHRTFNKWLLSKCDFFISVSENSRLDLITLFQRAASNSVTIPIGIPNADAMLSIDRHNLLDAPVFVSVGSFVPEKNHNFLVEVFHLYYKQNKKGFLWLIGDGKLRANLEAKIEGLGIKERVCFWGYRKDVISLLKSADVFVMPSLIEGLPGVILEAIACEIPVVASAVGGIPEIIENGVTGISIQDWSLDQYVGSINTLLNDHDYRKRLIKQAKINLLKRYTIEIVSRDFLIQYKQLLND